MLRIDLYTEISCPWCIIGQYRLDKVLRERFPGLATSIQHHPVLLMPGTPEGGTYIPDMLQARYGISDMKVAFARPEAEANASGLELDLSKQLWAYRTQPAHALIAAARGRGTEHEISVAISAAYFLEARNTGNTDVLADIAADFGFSKSEAIAIATDPAALARVEADAAASRAQGIGSVPHFIFGGELSINGGRTEDEIEAAIVAALRRRTISASGPVVTEGGVQNVP